MKRIICIGNRYRPRDAAGPLVYEELIARGPTAGIEVIDGGLAGLDLLRFVEGAERVVFVDALEESEGVCRVTLLTPDQAACTGEPAYDHAAGLGYLLGVLPAACEGPAPEIIVVGIEGRPSSSAVVCAAELALALARDGWQTGARSGAAQPGASR